MNTSQSIALEASSLSKKYGSVQALDDVTIALLEGQIHAIVGENGAGKSTLVNILAGNLKADSGSISAPNADIGTADSVAMVHQHFMLVPALSVRENLQLSASNRTPGTMLPSIENEAKIAEELGWELPLETLIRDLSVGMQQRIEIVKALAEDKSILVLDEPTAVLSPAEVEDLMLRLKDLCAIGKTIVLIAHKLSEVMSVADQITVLRNGKVVASEPTSNVNVEQVASWMVGEFPSGLKKREPIFHEGSVVLNNVYVNADRGNEAVCGVSLSINRGEIVGIGGVDGNGQVELAEAVAGIRSFRGGMTFPGSKGEPFESVAYIPQDRHRNGLALQMSVLENLLIGAAGREKRGLIPLRELKSEAKGWIEKYDVRTSSMDDPIRTLSGGNQQKAIIARILEQKPIVIVAVNPTRGLDVRATLDVHRKLIEAAESGVAVLVFSTDLDELSALADCTIFMSQGKLRDSLKEAVSGATS